MTLYQDCSSKRDSSKNIAARGQGLFSLYIYIENFKNLLVRNHETDFNITRLEYFFGNPLPRLFKPSDSSKSMAARGRGLFFLYYIENLLVRNSWTKFNVALVTFYQDCSSLYDTSKNMAPIYFVYICIENFTILLVKYPLNDFNITWLECCFGDPLPRLFKQSWFVKTTRLLGVGLIFPIYLNRKL